jgi:hypothetical protein
MMTHVGSVPHRGGLSTGRKKVSEPMTCEHCVYCILDGWNFCCMCHGLLTPEERDKHRRIMAERKEEEQAK